MAIRLTDLKSPHNIQRQGGETPSTKNCAGVSADADADADASTSVSANEEPLYCGFRSETFFVATEQGKRCLLCHLPRRPEPFPVATLAPSEGTRLLMVSLHEVDYGSITGFVEVPLKARNVCPLEISAALLRLLKDEAKRASFIAGVPVIAGTLGLDWNQHWQTEEN